MLCWEYFHLKMINNILSPTLAYILIFLRIINGLVIESRIPNKKLDFINNQESLNISLIDYFDGYNQLYLFSEGCMSYREYFEWDSKIENIDTYIIDSVSSINSVCHAIIYKVHYLLLFYCRNNLMQVSCYLLLS